MIPALISQVKGLAAFDDGKAVRYLSVLALDEISNDDFKILGRSLATAPDLEKIEVADLRALRNHLLMRRSREEALFAALLLLDGTNSPEIRKLAAAELTSSRREQWEWVEGVLMCTALPTTADTNGASYHAADHREFFDGLLNHQDVITQLRRIWDALPNENFRHESREQIRATVVRCGAFRNLLHGRATDISNPFNPALSYYSSELAAICREGNSGSIDGTELKKTIHGSQSVNPIRIWSVAPWRSSYLASSWGELEAKHANHSSTRTLLKLESASIDRKKKDFTSIFESWNELRHHSALSPAVNIISTLSNIVHFKNLNQLSIDNHSKLSISNSKSRLQKPTKSVWKGCDSNDLADIAINFFDVVDHVAPSTAVYESKEINKYSSPKIANENSPDWKLVVELIHNSISEVKATNTIFYDSNTSNSHRSDFSDTSKISRKLKTYVESFSDAITISALDKIFEQRGCIIWNLPESGSASSLHSPPSAAVLNLEQRQSHIFNGFVAIVLRFLQKRLRADLVSGLPLARCGWVALEELNTTGSKGTSYLEHEIEGLRRDLGRAGFETSTVESSSRRVRLNPKLAATPDS